MSGEPCIFNDVLGPVMRGPSSSHTAAAHRIGLILNDLTGNSLSRARFEFHPGGSLATTYHTQGSDLGLAAGLIGLDILDPRMPDSLELAIQSGLDLEFTIEDYPASHPNTYRCHLWTEGGREMTATALSTGGGMIRLTELDGFEVDLTGEFLVLYLDATDMNGHDLRMAQALFKDFGGFIDGNLVEQANRKAIFTRFRPSADHKKLRNILDEKDWWYRLLRPVMLMMGDIGIELPFRCLRDLEKMPAYPTLQASHFAIQYEAARTGERRDQLDGRMAALIAIWRDSIKKGLAGTHYADRIAGSQSPGFWELHLKGRLLPSGPLNRMVAYSTALMEMKSSMGVIIAAPTAGSCGGLPGCLIGMADELGLDDGSLSRGFWAAGLAGLFIAREGTFAAEVAGCQAETGAGAAMAAAGLVELFGGTAKQAMDAASMALQNIIGLVCDPVANRVEIPCLGRNAAATANALVSANLILGGIDAVIPFGETIAAMMETGRLMSHTLRCTALGGLSDTPTARRIEHDLTRNPKPKT